MEKYACKGKRKATRGPKRENFDEQIISVIHEEAEDVQRPIESCSFRHVN